MEEPSRKQSETGSVATLASSLNLQFPRRSTISVQRPAQVLPPHARLRKNPNSQCTHLTMTRLYTKEYRCSICLRTGSFGWLYRCTQDRELLLEDDLETGYEEKLDDMCDIFPRPTSPRKRGPVARMDKFAFLKETGEGQLKQYKTWQVNRILNQRGHVLKLAAQPDFTPLQAEIAPLRSQDLSNSGLDRALNGPRNSLDGIGSSMPESTKPWLPLRGGECQFKCCHFCRPSLRDRSFLSIDGIVDDDIPPTAITGFGFHLEQSRPVASAEIVKSLGLRPNPTRPRRKDTPTPYSSRTPAAPPTPGHAAALGLGLGIFTAPSTDDSAPTTIAPIPLPVSPNTVFMDTHDISQQQTSIRSFPLVNTITPIQRRHSISVPSTTSRPEAACQIPLPDQTPQELKLIQAGLVLTPHPDWRTRTEIKMVDNVPSLTPMEENELRGTFGREPLEVKDGVAVMEESVELHVPDVITQF